MPRAPILIALAGAGVGALVATLALGAWLWAGGQADWPFRLAFQQRIERGAANLPTPPNFDSRRRIIGYRLYAGLCARCHSEPSGGREMWADGLTPLPADLTLPGPARDPRRLFWIICHGESWSGMPAARAHHSDDAVWDLALFVQALPRMSPADYARLAATYGPAPAPLGMTPDADCYEKSK